MRWKMQGKQVIGKREKGKGNRDEFAFGDADFLKFIF